MKPVILLNGAPNSGKDVTAKLISEMTGLPHLEFKGRLFSIALAMSGLTQTEWDALYTRELKEVPTDKLFGLSPRQFLIKISEEVIKPNFGKQYFGDVLGKLAYGTGAVVSDSGFNKEAEQVVDICGVDNVFVVRFTRDGCSFEGDSRNFLTTNKVIHYLDTENNGTIEEFTEEIICWVNSLLPQSQQLFVSA